MIRKRPELDTENPPGQIVNSEWIEKTQKEWEAYQQSKNSTLKDYIDRVIEEEMPKKG